METEKMNKLYFGDCLDVLKDLHSQTKEGFIDLIYIDPPFNSNRNYNILFEEADLSDATAQKEAFADTWSNVSYKDTLQEIQALDVDLHNFLKALDSIRISKSAVAYLTTMAIRIRYMHKVLKNTGSFYLHCDPNMSHYLKIICDLIFGGKNFRNDISWKRQSGVSNTAGNQFPRDADHILFYSKTKENFYKRQYSEYRAETLVNYRYDDNDGRGPYRLRDPRDYSPDTLKKFEAEEKLVRGPKGGVNIKQYLSQKPGVTIGSV